MTDITSNIDIIRTKLYRPSLPPDIVPRPHLLQRLEGGQHRSLTLVSAPAGYGKSTLVSQWLDECGAPSAWLSLDPEDSDLRRFLRYVVTAIQSLVPEFGHEMNSLIRPLDLPPWKLLAQTLLKELSGIREPCVLALDDYHLIHNAEIHDLLQKLLSHPLPTLHLVIATRHDPPLPLARLRAQDRLTELRGPELRFSIEETRTFFRRIKGVKVDEGTAAALDGKIEGWVTGLRLATLSLRDGEDLERLLTRLPEENLSVAEYLLEEVFSQLSIVLQHCLLNTALLDRFCTPLCMAICQGRASEASGNSGQAHPPAPSLEKRGGESPPGPPLEKGGESPPGPFLEEEGEKPPSLLKRRGVGDEFFLKSHVLREGERGFVDHLLQKGLFVVELDKRQGWFRYHHLFQNFLQRRLRAQRSPQEIATMHRRAMRWFESQGLIDEALRQALAAEDLPAALELVAQHRQRLMNEEQWPRLASWLNRFSHDIVEQNPNLLILRVWLAYRRLRVAEMAPDLDKIKALRNKMPADASDRRRLRGEYAALRSYPQYLAADGEGACASAGLALKMLPDDALYARSMAVLMLSISMQIRGEFRGATELVYQALEQNAFHRTSHHTRIMAALCFVHWMEADLRGVEQIAAQHLALSQDLRLTESVQYAQYFLGSCHYQRNRLTEAERHVSTATHPGEVPTTREAFFCAVVLAFTRLAQGDPSAAHAIADRLLATVVKEGNSVVLRYLQTFKVELTLLQGEISEAVSMMRHVTPPPLLVIPRIYLPQLTAVKVGVAQATPESLQQAATLLAQLRKYHERVHHVPFQIEILAVQALLEEALGERSLALSSLTQALRLAEPGGFIRPFVDLGPGLAPLLKACGHQEHNLREYAARLLKARRDERIRATGGKKDEIPQMPSPAASAQNGLIEAVTNRELDILELLARRFRNQEIAERLCLSPKTVKKHLYNLYQKLDVHGRREAVAKAVELRLISQSESS